MSATYKAILALVIFIFTSLQASANSEWINSEKIRGRLIEQDGQVAVELNMAPHWHTYYKEPGDAGIPTDFNFTGSSNFEVEEVVFPKYIVIDEYGFKTNSYENQAIFKIKARSGNEPHIILNVSGAVCNEICIPYEFKFDYKPQISAPATEEGTGTVKVESLSLYILGIALLAGFILNIMPCVLPVLSLKILSVLKQSGKEKKHARLNFMATSAGILTSFLALAVITISLKSAGMAVGWGLHFQSPIFVGVLLAITLAFSFSLFGFFHLNPPSWISGTGEHKNSFIGNFFSGVLATLLGTSCTAPVLVTAVGYALTGTNLDIIVIFAAMGIGMALPFLLLALKPALVSFLPKPGNWMVRVKQFMGVLLLITSAWLAFVLYSQLTTTTEDEKWKNFDQAEISQLVDDGKTVFVDITAQWCVNCKANKATVVDTDEIQNFFTENKVVLMKGDLTKPSSTILAYIKSFGRYGIPVNVVYGPHAKDGILLDALLSKEAVKEAINKAK